MKARFFGLLLILVSGVDALSQPGGNDPTFNSLDVCSPGTGLGFDAASRKAVVQSDGKIIIGGDFLVYDDVVVNRIVRTNSDGTIDTSFHTGTGFNNKVEAITLQPDGKILIGGSFTTYDGVSANRIIRLNTDGTVDSSFNTGTGFNNYPKSILVMPDGSLIIGGNFTSFNGTSASRIIGLNSDGSINSGFNTGTGFNAIVVQMAAQTDNKVIVVGSFAAYNGTLVNSIVRINPDGTSDNSFNIGSGFDDDAFSVTLQPDGKMIVGGNFTSFNGTAATRIIRLNGDGTHDPTFNPGSGFNASVNGITLQGDGKLIVGGNFTSYNGTTVNYITRLNSNGSIDNTFNTGSGFDGWVFFVTLQSDGKIIALGSFTNYTGVSKNRLARLNTDGTLDASYDGLYGFNNFVYESIRQPDGKIIAVGSFVSFNGVENNRIVCLNENGSQNYSVDFGSGANDLINAVALQPDGKILIGGDFTSFDGTSINRLARLNADGSIDPTFNIGSGFDGLIWSIAVQTDGKILVGGDFASFNGGSTAFFLRLNSNGTLDPTFNIGTGFSEYVSSILLQPDGKILVGGGFVSFNGTFRNRIARLNNDGTLDATFNSSSGFNYAVEKIALQSDGKVVAVGNFTSYAGSTRNRIARINSNGTIDNTFTTGVSGFNGIVNDVVIQSDGKIIAGGFFTTYTGNSSVKIARIESDGSFDPTFVTGTGFVTETGPSANIFSLILQPDEKIVVLGNFKFYNGICRNGIARLVNDDCNTSSTVNVTGCDSLEINGQTYTSSGTYTQVISNIFGCDSTITINLTIIDVTDLNLNVNQTYATLTAIESGANYQWLNCNTGFTPLTGENAFIFMPDTAGFFAVEIDKAGCIDTSICIEIEIQDFYEDPSYTTLSAEVFALPVTTIDTCDAIAFAYPLGGIPPYHYNWFTQPNNQDLAEIDQLCEGIHTLKVTDNLGDSVLVDYYITDTANFYDWYDTTLAYVDTVYVAAPNCALDYSLPLDSASITEFYFIGMDTIPPGELYFIEITYYQAGITYIHQDTISVNDDGWYLIDFSVYCPVKSFNKIKTLLLGLNFPAVLSVSEESQINPLLIYPNPTSGLLTISGLSQNASVEIITLLGEQVLFETSSGSLMNLDLGHVADGIYLIRVKSQTGTSVHTLVKN